MSYQYLYGFTNEPSYDFNKVIYFGKQDRCDINLKRIVEHYRAEDPNHKELSAAQFIIFCQVPTRCNLSALEAYFIQTYRPSLNSIYNADKNGVMKLDDKQLQEIYPDAEALVWNLIKNDRSSVLSMSGVLSEIEKQNNVIKNAMFTFENRQALDSMKCLDIVSSINGKYAVVAPTIQNSLVHPITVITANDERIKLEPYENGRFSPKKHVVETIQY